jgi:hypothetical protein
VLFITTGSLSAAGALSFCTGRVGVAFVVEGASFEIVTPLVGVVFGGTSESLPLSVAVGSVVFKAAPIKEADALEMDLLA